MNLTRRSFLKWASAAAGAMTVGPALGVRTAGAAGSFKAKRVVVVSIAGGLRLHESLGMAEGATMPNLFGDVPLISGFGGSPAGPPRIAPEYLPTAPTLALPKPRKVPLFTEGALVTNLRYAEGAPGHLQGAACLVSGAYNNIDNRADAHAPAPTLFELHRRKTNAPATDAWYLSVLPGFFRSLQSSDHPEYGAKFGATWMSPGAIMSPLVPIVTSGERALDFSGQPMLPSIKNAKEEIAAKRRLVSVLDGDFPAYGDDGPLRGTPEDNEALEQHLAEIFGDATYDRLFPQSFGIGVADGGRITGTGDAVTTYHAEEVLKRWKPSVMVVSLFDVDNCHTDFNSYLLNQQIADACVNHLWETIQTTEGLRDETALIVVPEHGRQLDWNGKSPDSLGRSGLDHGGGDDGDRDVFLLALGPDFKKGVYAPTDIQKEGRASGRYETIDAIMSAAAVLGCNEEMKKELEGLGMRPGLVMEDILL